jgi:hypothetical protein
LDQPDLAITVIDVGARLPEANRARAEGLRASLPSQWLDADWRAVTAVAKAQNGEVLPEKSVLGSTYPFDNFGQMTGVSWEGGTHVKAISGALGGFSNVWGAQGYPFTKRALALWPDEGKTMASAYQDVVKVIPLAGRDDELATVLPLYGDLLELPPLAERSRRMLAASARSREKLQRKHLVAGAARVCFHANQCLSCGLCNSGCVWDLLFSTRQLFERWIAKGQIRYYSNTLAISISERPGGQPAVEAMTVDGAPKRFVADRIFVGAGAIGSTRIVLNSLPGIKRASLLETRQVIIPLWSRRPVPNPQAQPAFTVAQAAIMIAAGTPSEAFLQFYPYDPSFVGALPTLLSKSAAVRQLLVRHLSVGIVYLNSDQSPRLLVERAPAGGGGSQSAISLSGARLSLANRNVRRVLRSVLSASRTLDMWPLVPAAKVSPAGRSYHWGGSFPYSPEEGNDMVSDRFGRIKPWRKVHLIDAATFPTLAPTGFLLTVMANAHRIASESLGLDI